MADTHNPNREIGAPAGSGAEPDTKATILLSDIPDASTLTPVPVPGIAEGNLGSGALAALGQRYDILTEAGHGNMGNVYKARDRETGETLALKLVKQEFASDQRMMERFKNELLFARKITHKNVCRVYEFNRIGGVAYTSMEFVEGESLRSVLNRFGGLPLRKSIDLTLQICSGLKEAHAQGIVHRDLKPENVMIDSQGTLKIMDFGIARSMEAATRLTGAMVGTPAYMAPEQVAGKPVDYRTDVYSLGLMLYEIFTGKPAFTADNPVAIALKQMREAPVPPHEIEPTVPVSIERAILKCLEKDPAKRYQTIADLEKDVSSSGACAVLASSGDTGTAVATREMIGNPQISRPIAKPPARKTAAKKSSAVVWFLFGAFGVLGAASAARWIAVMRPMQALSASAKQPAPAPPDFALDKTTARVPANASPKVAPPADTATAENSETSTSASDTTVQAQQTPTPGAPPSSAAPKAMLPSPEQSATLPSTDSQAPKQRPFGQAGAFLGGAGSAYVWVGRFQREDRAQDTAKRIEDLGYPVVVVPRHNPTGQFFVVLSGPLGEKRAEDVLQQLQQQGFDNLHLIKNLKLNPND